jgi:ribonuclease P protein component
MDAPCLPAGALKAAINSRSATREPFGTPNSLRFPKSSRILRSSDFRKAYQEGVRFTSPYFAAFCLAVPRASTEGPRLGFTLPRAFGKSVKRNRAKRRLREILRLRLADIAPQWDLVINPRRTALAATSEQLQQAIDRLVAQCGKR